jgi:hypothetical protein
LGMYKEKKKHRYWLKREPFQTKYNVLSIKMIPDDLAYCTCFPFLWRWTRGKEKKKKFPFQQKREHEINHHHWNGDPQMEMIYCCQLFHVQFFYI